MDTLKILNSGYDTKRIKAQIQETHNFCHLKDMEQADEIYF
jgi:hypothetical protein